MKNDHTCKAFDSDLEWLSIELREMGKTAETQIADAIVVFEGNDNTRANNVLRLASSIEVLHDGVEEKAVLTIARRQPMARDLREIVAAFKTCEDIERIGRLAKNAVERSILINGSYPENLHRNLAFMARLALEQFRETIDCYFARTSKSASTSFGRGKDIGAVQSAFAAEVLAFMRADANNVPIGVDLMFCSENIERICAHTANIADTAHYMFEGYYSNC
jgi:phosphate transport system protein